MKALKALIEAPTCAYYDAHPALSSLHQDEGLTYLPHCIVTGKRSRARAVRGWRAVMTLSSVHHRDEEVKNKFSIGTRTNKHGFRCVGFISIYT